MKIQRTAIFETNSSSTHSLVMNSHNNQDYLAPNSTILVNFVNTDDDYRYDTLQEKVSYLVGHIIRGYKYNAANYNDLIEDVKDSYDFKRLSKYVRENFDKEIVFPETYEGDLEDIVTINHQLIENSLDDVLTDLCSCDHDYLDDVLSPNVIIKLGRD